MSGYVEKQYFWSKGGQYLTTLISFSFGNPKAEGNAFDSGDSSFTNLVILWVARSVVGELSLEMI